MNRPLITPAYLFFSQRRNLLDCLIFPTARTNVKSLVNCCNHLTQSCLSVYRPTGYQPILTAKQQEERGWILSRRMKFVILIWPCTFSTTLFACSMNFIFMTRYEVSRLSMTYFRITWQKQLVDRGALNVRYFIHWLVAIGEVFFKTPLNVPTTCCQQNMFSHDWGHFVRLTQLT